MITNHVKEVITTVEDRQTSLITTLTYQEKKFKLFGIRLLSKIVDSTISSNERNPTAVGYK